jgi:hypothetical protein
MLKKSASLSCAIGLFGLSGLFGCVRLTADNSPHELAQKRNWFFTPLSPYFGRSGCTNRDEVEIGAV